jgi:hypothetical protein
MPVNRAEVLHVSIESPPGEVVTFLGDLTNWTTWAPWVRSVSRLASREWQLATDAGRMHVRFVEENTLGVLDHHVTLESGSRSSMACGCSPMVRGASS